MLRCIGDISHLIKNTRSSVWWERRRNKPKPLVENTHPLSPHSVFFFSQLRNKLCGTFISGSCCRLWIGSFLLLQLLFCVDKPCIVTPSLAYIGHALVVLPSPRCVCVGMRRLFSPQYTTAAFPDLLPDRKQDSADKSSACLHRGDTS